MNEVISKLRPSQILSVKCGFRESFEWPRNKGGVGTKPSWLCLSDLKLRSFFYDR